MADPFVVPTDVVEAALRGDTSDVPDGYSANALVCRPADGAVETEGCEHLLTAFDSVNVLGVAVTHEPDYYVRMARQSDRLDPERVAVVDVNPVSMGEEYGVTVVPVTDASDLTGIGISVTKLLKRVADSDRPTAVCIDSLTPLLRYSDLDRCYRFLDITTSRLNQVCAVSHVHLNPRAHDERTVNQIGTLFDAVIEHGAGGWQVSQP